MDKLNQFFGKWQMIIAVGSIVAIALHFVFSSHTPLLIIIAGGGVPLVIQIMLKLFKSGIGVDFLGAIELVAAAVLEQYLAAVLIILMLAGGQALERYAMRRASAVLRALADRMPSVAHRKHNHNIEDIPLVDIAIGDNIVVFPHETAPVDGEVVEGYGSMDESYLTGEPYQVSKTIGADVLSGAINGEAVLVIRAEKIARDSRYAQIMHVMQEAEQKRPAMRRISDTIGGWFSGLALLVAAIVWYATGNSLTALAVIVVATPCPLIIAIPITIISAISMAAKRGIVIKDPTVLERLPTCRTAIFDKTGTLTYGKPKLTEIIPAEGLLANEILQSAASLERYSKHPLANAILQAAEQNKLSMIEAESVSEKPGQGLTGVVLGMDIFVTSRKKLLQYQPQVNLPPTAPGLECIIMRDNKYAATFRFRDAPRSSGKHFISHLGPAHQFNRVMLVSGDRASEVTYLAELLGIKYMLASQSPEQKVAIVRAETLKAPTLFMGDGINDAPALASATVGVAFGQHSSITAEAAGAVIMENSLEKVDELIHISTKLRRIALQSAIGGIMISIIGMGFAAFGTISPVEAALIQELIDVIAIANALRMTLGTTVEIDLNTGNS
jgi:heavy metal translocating P-type ATPase